jgi:hypothetical protein
LYFRLCVANFEVSQAMFGRAKNNLKMGIVVLCLSIPAHLLAV